MSRRNVRSRRPQASKRARQEGQGAALSEFQGLGGSGYWVRALNASDRRGF